MTDTTLARSAPTRWATRTQFFCSGFIFATWGVHIPTVKAHVGQLLTKLDLTVRVWRESPAHASELLGDNARLSADLIATYHSAMRDLLTGTVGEAIPAADAAEFAELLLAFTRGLEADLSDPDAPARRLRHGVTLLVAGLSPQEPS